MNSTSGATRHLDGFEATVKDFWASRPRRPAQGRKIAGVAAGIGLRYGIDPIVIRVALVVLTFFGGVGPAVYLLGWLFLPGADDEVSPFEALLGHGGSATSKVLTLLLCAACFPAFGLAFGGTWLDGGGLIGLALVVTALYLMHRGRGHLNRPVAARAGTFADPTAPEPGTRVDTATADWDALGANPMGWHLADPSTPVPSPPPEEPERPPQQRPRRRRCVSKVTLVTLALAVITAGVTANVLDAAWGPAEVAAATLAVLAGGLLVGAFTGGARGLIWFAVPTAAVAVLTSAWPAGGYPGGVGEIIETPRTAAQLDHTYERTAGAIDIDLTELEMDERATPSGTVPVEARVGTGDITFTVPRDADVTYDCTAHTGSAMCLGKSQSGVSNQSLVGRDNGDDGTGGPRFHLVLETGVGNVEVRRHG
ncbi:MULTISPECIES: PspC domain-containing protein [Prauserella salsuginis group]|uniref:PspC domain-containing protein n=1 Tax=Prauserella salsuginis TaxID=387889 RepID=A0ABW6G2P3_9PSEU|nr:MULTISPECIES: PspC domain-containing protein [Prauserella salsuginis group]